MFKIINSIIMLVLPIIPKSLIKIFARQYVAGTTIKESLAIVKKLNDNNLYATIDILGEHTKNINEANEITSNYIRLIENIKKNNLKCNLSIKPSHIGTDISNDIFNENLNKILNKAMVNNNFIRIDMEDSTLTDISINTYKSINSQSLGIVLQAYLYRTIRDIKNLKNNSNIRLCKGIYNEDPNIAIKNNDKIDENYLKLLKLLFKKQIYVGIATHSEKLISKSIELINEMNINRDSFEFQMLYGVPMEKTINILLENNYKVRIYVPFGPLWYEYSIRRIKENPNILKYVIKNILNKIKEALL